MLKQEWSVQVVPSVNLQQLIPAPAYKSLHVHLDQYIPLLAPTTYQLPNSHKTLDYSFRYYFHAISYLKNNPDPHSYLTNRAYIIDVHLQLFSLNTGPILREQFLHRCQFQLSYFARFQKPSQDQAYTAAQQASSTIQFLNHRHNPPHVITP